MPSYSLTPDVAQESGDLLVGDPARRGSSWLLLGESAESGARRRVKVDTTAEHVVAIVGKRGTGKSYSLGVFLEGLGVGELETTIGRADPARAALVFDVLDVFWTSSLKLQPSEAAELSRQYERMKAARLDAIPIAVDTWIPAGYENSQIDLPSTKILRIAPSELEAEDWAALFDLDLVSEPRGMLLEELVRKVSRTGWIDGGGASQPPLPVYSVPDLLCCLENDAAVQADYAEGTRRSLRQRLSAQANNPLFQGTPTPLSQVVRAGRVAVLMLGRLPDSFKQVIASLYTRRILRERNSVSFAKKRLDLDSSLGPEERESLMQHISDGVPRTWILADEAQVLAGADAKSLSGEALIKYAKEGRNYGLSLAIATQQPSAVDSRLMSQVETLVVHQLATKHDIEIAVRSMKSPLPESIRMDGQVVTPDAMIRSLEQGQAVFSCANAGRAMQRAMVVRVRARVTAHGGYEA